MNKLEEKNKNKVVISNAKKVTNKKYKHTKKEQDTTVKTEVSTVNFLKKSIKKILQKIYETKAFVVLTAILLLLKTILLYKVAIFANNSIKFEDIYKATIFIAIFMFIPMLLKSTYRFWFALSINLAISVVLCANEIYYVYASNLLSISQISNLQYGREISIALPNLVNIRQIFYFVDIIISFILVVSKKVKINKKEKNKITPCIIYAILVIFIITKQVSVWIQEASTYQYNKVQQIEASSIYGYHYIDIANNINMKKNLKYKTKTIMLSEYKKLMEKYEENYNLKYDYTNIAQDKNVIIVQLESVQNFVLNKEINGSEITPNLNKFINENIEFTNMQNQSYSSTADSEYAVMNSIYPLENGMSFAQYASNDYSDIYKMFKNNGYTTTYIHGNKGAFWNRESVYSRLKIDNLLFDNVFDENTERINNYISDEQVYRKVVDEIKKYDNKFLVNIVAASSHIAFDLPGIENKENKVNIDVGEKYKDTLFGNYLEAVNYADYAFGIFINELKNAGLYDDTVILVYGDHAGLQMYNEEMLDYMGSLMELNDVKTQINYSNVVCRFKSSRVK